MHPIIHTVGIDGVISFEVTPKEEVVPCIMALEPRAQPYELNPC